MQLISEPYLQIVPAWLPNRSPLIATTKSYGLVMNFDALYILVWSICDMYILTSRRTARLVEPELSCRNILRCNLPTEIFIFQISLSVSLYSSLRRSIVYILCFTNSILWLCLKYTLFFGDLRVHATENVPASSQFIY